LSALEFRIFSLRVENSSMLPVRLSSSRAYWVGDAVLGYEILNLYPPLMETLCG
jgi:hypothetical protein